MQPLYPFVWFYWTGQRSLVLKIILQAMSFPGLEMTSYLGISSDLKGLQSWVCLGWRFSPTSPASALFAFLLLNERRRQDFRFHSRSTYPKLVPSSQNCALILMPNCLQHLVYSTFGKVRMHYYCLHEFSSTQPEAVCFSAASVWNYNSWIFLPHHKQIFWKLCRHPTFATVSKSQQWSISAPREQTG